MIIAKPDRAALFSAMREAFHEEALKNMTLYGEFCAALPEDAVEKNIDALWYQSVTNGSEGLRIYCISPLWKSICNDVLLRDGHQCMACQRDAEVVHHRSYAYDVMAGRDDSKLIALCRPCHHYIHFHKMEKTAPVKWEKRLRHLQRYFARKQTLPHSNWVSRITAPLRMLWAWF